MKKIKFFCMIWSLFVLAGCMSEHQNNLNKTAYLKILTAENPPLNFIKDGEITGQATEVVKEILKRTGNGKDIRLVNWEEGYQALLEQPNIVLFSTVMTSERKDLLQWVGPIMALETNLYALKGSEINIATLEDAKKANKIATVSKYYSEQILKEEGFTNIKSCPDRETTLRKLLDGEVQLLASGNNEIPAALEKVGASTDDIKNIFTISTDLAYIAFSKGTSPDLVTCWQNALDEMKRDGTFARIYTRWFPNEIPPGILQLMTEEYPPVTFMRDGKPAGFVTDMVREIASRQGISDNVRLTSWKNAYNLTLIHPNVVLFSTERTPERENLFQWVGPVGKNSAIFYAKKGSGIRISSLEDARRIASIATTTNWFTEQYLKNEGFTNLVSSPVPETNVKQLMNGEVKLSVFTDITIPEIVKKAGYSMDDLEPLFTVSNTYFYIAMSLGTPPDIVKKWQSILDDLKSDGTFEKIYRNYIPSANLTDLLNP
ncbi:transporter substrate-binding domain-containing protein [bacterium]|nr:transporter substrate-binding domain-containing protein [bacterium]